MRKLAQSSTFHRLEKYELNPACRRPDGQDEGKGKLRMVEMGVRAS